MLFTNAVLATMAKGAAPYGLIPSGALAVEGGRIAWCGAQADIPPALRDWPARDVAGRLITPALIDCHTHIIYGGNRAHEFEMRLEGASYEDIARAGGGILSTVKATRAASEDSLLASALPRVDALLAEGVATIEIKSGYGLNIETELQMLRVARRIAETRQIHVRTTFLAAHAVPLEYKDKADAYIDEICLPGMKAAKVAGLADAVDGFCEGIGFTTAQMKRVFEKAHELNLPVKLHAEQLSNLGGAMLAASYNALSADHLEYIDVAGIAAMASAGTVAVILPGAFYTLGEARPPPIAALRAAGVPMAVATDCNPGSSPLTSILTAMNMACTLFKMTPEEAFAGATREAAHALGLNDVGVLGTGMRADLAIWNVEHPCEIAYHIGFNPLQERIFGDIK